MRWTTLAGVLIAASLVVVVPRHPAHAEEPTLKETIDFVSKKLSQCESMYGDNRKFLGHDVLVIVEVHSEMRLVGSNKIEVHSKFSESHNRPKDFVTALSNKENYKNVVDLSDLSTEIRIEDSGMGFEEFTLECFATDCIESQLSTFWQVGNNEPTTYEGTLNESNLTLFVCSEHAERVVNALEHAIRISGGRDELF